MQVFRRLYGASSSFWAQTSGGNPFLNLNGGVRSLYYKRSNPRRADHEIKYPEKWIVRRVRRPRFAPPNSIYTSSSLDVIKSINRVPYKYKDYIDIIPTLLPQAKVSLVKKTTSKYGQYIVKRTCPNVVYKFLYSKALDTSILFRTSTKVLRLIDGQFNGALDEYLKSLKPESLNCSIAASYQEKVRQASTSKL